MIRKDENLSKVEVAKEQGCQLRGSIAETVDADANHFVKDDTQLLKFHGIYQQDDRDERNQRRGSGDGKAYMFMVRLALPGGVLTAEQYLAIDQLAVVYGNGSLRITSRQGIQFHRVLKSSLKPLIAQINCHLMTTLGACGDVERNVMCCPAPLGDEPHRLLHSVAREIAAELKPKSRAYHEIWLDEEKVCTSQDQEPFYGTNYLPRKFKTGIALQSDNCIDVHSCDCALVAFIEKGELAGFNVLVGGGMGMTHNKQDTFAGLAHGLGFVKPDNAVEAVRTVAAIFRDHGNRADRRHARLKYLLHEWGMPRFREEFCQRVPFELLPERPTGRIPYHDHLGKAAQGNGKYFYGVYVPNGRIIDGPQGRYKSALNDIVKAYRPGIRLTAQQNLLLTDLDEHDVEAIEQTLKHHNVPLPGQLSGVRLHSMACPALPTCGLALADSERVMPDVLDLVEAELKALGIVDVPLTVRMTGCPNGCARPYTADIGLVGRRPGVYHVYVGGSVRGDHMADLYAADVAQDQLMTTLRPLLKAWADKRKADESLGDYYQRLIGHDDPRMRITGAEQPTQLRILEQVPG